MTPDMPATPVAPQFTHDCPHCVFLGPLGREDGSRFDVYVCPQRAAPDVRAHPTVVMRWGNDGPEYDSGRQLAADLPEPMRSEAIAQMQTFAGGG